jgi:hypothetical protein
MTKIATGVTADQTTCNALKVDYEAYIEQLKMAWNKENPFDSDRVVQTWNASERERWNQHAARWAKYVTPLAEQWCKEKGYRIIWPDDNTQPTRFEKIASEK